MRRLDRPLFYRSFPRLALDPRNRLTARHRLSHLLQWWIALRGGQHIKNAPAADFGCLALVCPQDLLLLRANLTTMARHASKLPQLVLALDEALSEGEARHAMAFWPGQIAYFTRDTTAKYHEETGSNLIAEFCRRSVFGYKFAACLRRCITGRFLYCDADVLWFRDVVPFVDNHSRFPIFAATDPFRSYNEAFLACLPPEDRQRLVDPPFVNAGFAVWNSVPDQGFINRMLSVALAGPNVHPLTEQTMVATFAKTVGGIIAAHDVNVMVEPRSFLRPSFRHTPWVARHYIGPVREQFWLDAWWALRSSLVT